MIAHLCDDEIYNQACLDGTFADLDFSGGLDASNQRGVRRRRAMTPAAVRLEWERRQRRVRRAWGRIGLEGKIETAGAGRYPLRLQVWHLAQEYAIHADDIQVPVPARARARRVPLEAETFIAYLTRRPQQLKDPAQRRLVQRLLGQ